MRSSSTLWHARAFRVYFLEVALIRWFADLPIERKLRVVIGAPALAAFAVALFMHIASSLVHAREDLRRCSTRIARVTGVNVIKALEAGDDKAAMNALSALRQELIPSGVDISLPDGRTLASYDRLTDAGHDIRIDPFSKTLPSLRLRAPADFDPAQHPVVDFEREAYRSPRPPSPTERSSAWYASPHRSTPSIRTGSAFFSPPPPA